MSEKKVKKLTAPKNMFEKPIQVETGTRFVKGSARQLAFETVLAGVKLKKTIKDIRKDLLLVRRENGYKYDLDASYANYVLSLHPEYFKVYVDGSIELLCEPKVDYNAVVEMKRKDVKQMRKISSKVKKMRKKLSKRG